MPASPWHQLPTIGDGHGARSAALAADAQVRPGARIARPATSARTRRPPRAGPESLVAGRGEQLEQRPADAAGAVRQPAEVAAARLIRRRPRPAVPRDRRAREQRLAGRDGVVDERRLVEQPRPARGARASSRRCRARRPGSRPGPGGRGGQPARARLQLLLVEDAGGAGRGPGDAERADVEPLAAIAGARADGMAHRPQRGPADRRRRRSPRRARRGTARCRPCRRRGSAPSARYSGLPRLLRVHRDARPSCSARRARSRRRRSAGRSPPPRPGSQRTWRPASDGSRYGASMATPVLGEAAATASTRASTPSALLVRPHDPVGEQRAAPRRRSSRRRRPRRARRPGASSSVKAGISGSQMRGQARRQLARAPPRIAREHSPSTYSTAASQRSSRNGWSATLSRNGTPLAVQPRRERADQRRAHRRRHVPVHAHADLATTPARRRRAPSRSPGESAGSSFGSAHARRRRPVERGRRSLRPGPARAAASSPRRPRRRRPARTVQPASQLPRPRFACDSASSSHGSAARRLRLAPARRHRPARGSRTSSRAPRAGTRRGIGAARASSSSASSAAGSAAAPAAEPRVLRRPARSLTAASAAATCSR